MKPPYGFRALETFEEPILKSTYMKDMTYTVRAGNTILHDFVQRWLHYGQVELTEAGQLPTTKVSGQGKVT